MNVASCNMQNGALPSPGAPSQPETWPQVCSLGMRQSPIDIPLRNAAAAAAAAATGGRPLQPIEIRGYGRVDGRVINTGHGLQVRNTVIHYADQQPSRNALVVTSSRECFAVTSHAGDPPLAAVPPCGSGPCDAILIHQHSASACIPAERHHTPQLPAPAERR